VPLVVIQAGHTGRTAGPWGPDISNNDKTGGPGEALFAWEAALNCRDALVARGYVAKVIQADPPPSAYVCDVFVAIHCDASDSPQSHGASVGYQNQAGGRMAAAFKRAYVSHGWPRGFRPDNYTEALHYYYGCRKALDRNPDCLAVIVESGFQTNPEDRQLLRGPGGRSRVAVAIADAIDEATGRRPPAPEDDMYSEADRKRDIYISAQVKASAQLTVTMATRLLRAVTVLDDKVDAVIAGDVLDDAKFAAMKTTLATVKAEVEEAAAGVQKLLDRDDPASPPNQ
jgi:hypothetical protein